MTLNLIAILLDKSDNEFIPEDNMGGTRVKNQVIRSCMFMFITVYQPFVNPTQFVSQGINWLKLKFMPIYALEHEFT